MDMNRPKVLMDISVKDTMTFLIDEVEEICELIVDRIMGSENSNSDTEKYLSTLCERLSNLIVEYSYVLSTVPEMLKMVAEVNMLQKRVDKRSAFLKKMLKDVYEAQKPLNNLILKASEKLRRVRISEVNRVYSEEVHRYAHLISKDHTTEAPDWWRPGDGVKLERGYPSKDMIVNFLYQFTNHDLGLKSIKNEKSRMARDWKEEKERRKKEDPSHYAHEQMLLNQQRQANKVRENNIKIMMGIPTNEEEETATLGEDSSGTDPASALRSQSDSQSSSGLMSRSGANSDSRCSSSATFNKTAQKVQETPSPRSVHSGSRSRPTEADSGSNVASPGISGPATASPPMNVQLASQTTPQPANVSPAHVQAEEEAQPVLQASEPVPMDTTGPAEATPEIELSNVEQVEHMTSDSSSSSSSGDEASPDK